MHVHAAAAAEDLLPQHTLSRQAQPLDDVGGVFVGLASEEML